MTEKKIKQRKEKNGVVVSTKMDKTVIVNVERTIPHPKYGKVITRGKRYYAHCETNDIKEGDLLEVYKIEEIARTLAES